MWARVYSLAHSKRRITGTLSPGPLWWDGGGARIICHAMSLLHIQNLTKGFVSPDGQRTKVIDVPAFQLEDRAQLALEGQSGCGKTTFLNLIAGILAADGGRIDLAGTNVCTLSESARDLFRARHIGFVFQTFHLLDAFSALENVELGMMFGAGVDRSFARELLEQLGLGDRLSYAPSQLSVGQKQRVALARALANRPKLVLADEPTGSLDARHAQEALELMRELCTKQGAALLLVSHDRDVLESFETRLSLAEINHASETASTREVPR